MTLTVPALTDEQGDLRDMMRALLSSECDSHRVRHCLERPDGTDRALWTRLAEEVGAHGIGVPEDVGGAGGSPLDTALLFEELGRSLACGPYLSTLGLAVPALLPHAHRPVAADLLGRLLSGSATATVVLNGALLPWEPGSVTIQAHSDGARTRLSGSAEYVLDGHLADVLLVAARMSDGIALFHLRAAAPGVERTGLTSLDLTRRFGSIRLDDAAADLLAPAGEAEPGLARASDLALVALAAEQLGGAQKCLETAVEYARGRMQFGRAIGSFQAVKHRCADMLVAVENARSTLLHAAWTAYAEPERLPEAAATAKACCSETFVAVSQDSLRVHGGIGFTWEHDAHLYVRRALSSHALMGTPALHHHRLADLLDSAVVPLPV